MPNPARHRQQALHELSVAEAGDALRAGTITSLELTLDALARVEALDPRLHAFVLVTRERALADAERADGDLASGIDRGPLHGIPYGLKDIVDTAHIATTCHSKLRLHHVPDEDAEVETRLRAGGAVLLGKLATHELALGGPSFELPFPPARNPWNTDHFTGASSSGSATAVAAGLLRVAIGSDTSGSIRGPACLCGTVGLKPTYGLVSRRGIFPLSYSLDTVGTLGWTVRDAALMLQVIAGHDPADPSSVPSEPLSFTAPSDPDLRGLRIGYVRHFISDAESYSEEVLQHLDAAANVLSGLGADVEETSLPSYALFHACGRVIMMAEALAIHEHELRVRPEAFARYTYQRIIAAASLSASDLVQAQRVRRELCVELNEQHLAQFDVLLCPTGLFPAPRFDAFTRDWPPPVHTSGMQTIPFTVTGNPALAMPCGRTRSGLPTGLQLVARAFDERLLVRVGEALEAALRLFVQRPALSLEEQPPC